MFKKKPKTKRQVGGGGPKRRVEKAAKRPILKQTNSTPEPPTPEPPKFHVDWLNTLTIELHAPNLPRMFPNHDQIIKINFTVGYYPIPLQNSNILARLNFAQFTNLQSFQLYTANVITGTLPPSLFTLPNLLDITIIDNKDLTGLIPNLPSRLRTLNLSNNELSGPIPRLLGTPHLQMLKLENNRLSGSIPDLPDSLTNVELDNNMLDGFIPHLPPNLREFRLSNNRLSGHLPELLPPLLNVFDVQNNHLSGVIPNNAVRRMSTFYLSGNNFFRGADTDPILSIRNLLTMVDRRFIDFRYDPAFYEEFEDMPPDIQQENDYIKLTHLLERLEASADPLM